MILGKGGDDQIFGGAEGDYCSATTTRNASSAAATRKSSRAIPGSVGVMTPQADGAPALYLTGSNRRDEVTAIYSAGATVTGSASGAGSQVDLRR